MAIALRQHLMSGIGQLRYEPITSRLRAFAGDTLLLDSTAARLVWEPRRILPCYWVPDADLRAELAAAEDDGADAAAAGAGQDVTFLDGPPVLPPMADFGRHTTPGTRFDLRSAGGSVAAFRPDDAELHAGVSIDFAGPTRWLEEEDEVVSHPRDPFHRIDVRVSSRPVEIRRDGVVLASSEHPHVLTETLLPPRYYFRREDVALDRLDPSETSTACAYKGWASYYALDGEDVAWTYADPLDDARPVDSEIAFFNERVDIVVDGTPVDRPRTPWS
jgi:uncharacterized protein (DUF427 family)